MEKINEDPIIEKDLEVKMVETIEEEFEIKIVEKINEDPIIEKDLEVEIVETVKDLWRKLSTISMRSS